MTTHVDIDLSTLPHVKLSPPFSLLALDLNEATAPSRIPSFLEQKQTFACDVTESGHVTAVVYWFELELGAGVQVCTLDPGCHWRQAAVMQKKPIDVHSGDTVRIHATLKNSCIDVTLRKSQ